MNTCFVIKNYKTGAYHTIQKDGKQAIISFATLEQTQTFKRLVNDFHEKNTFKKTVFVPKKTSLTSLSKSANLSCVDVLFLEKDYTYTLYPATCIETLDDGEFRFYLENKYVYDQ